MLTALGTSVIYGDTMLINSASSSNINLRLLSGTARLLFINWINSLQSLHCLLKKSKFILYYIFFSFKYNILIVTPPQGCILTAAFRGTRP